VLSVVDLLCHDPFIILDQNKLKSLWNVPHNRNPNVTGQEEHLASLKMALSSGKPAALTQAIYWLGGVGKTQLALE